MPATTASSTAQAMAEQRVAQLYDEDASLYSRYDRMYARRDVLRAELDAWGLSPVQTIELRLIEEEVDGYEEELEAQQRAEIYAEGAWLRAAEYDPRMEDPREC